MRAAASLCFGELIRFWSVEEEWRKIDWATGLEPNSAALGLLLDGSHPEIMSTTLDRAILGAKIRTEYAFSFVSHLRTEYASMVCAVSLSRALSIGPELPIRISASVEPELDAVGVKHVTPSKIRSVTTPSSISVLELDVWRREIRAKLGILTSRQIRAWS